MTDKTFFRAYNHCGEMVCETWTSAPSTEFVERSVYQDKLNKSDFLFVDVVTSKGFTERMWPESAGV